MGGIISILRNGGGLQDLIACIISSAIVIFLTLPIHEYAHGFAATKLGDPTPRRQGRMSLNPLRHLDYIGSLMILFIGFGWAKPVQVDSRYFKNEKRDMAITAFAGPLSNICVSIVSSLIGNAVLFVAAKSGVNLFVNDASAITIRIIYTIFNYIALINISLAIFNLIPIPPLDGSKILAMFLPDRIYYQLMRYEQYFTFILIFLLVGGFGFSNVLNKVVAAVFNLVQDLTWLPFNPFINW